MEEEVQHFIIKHFLQMNQSLSSRMAHFTGLRLRIALTTCIMSTRAAAMCAATAATGTGVRVLVSLKSDVLLGSGSGDGSVGNKWKIVGQ